MLMRRTQRTAPVLFYAFNLTWLASVPHAYQQAARPQHSAGVLLIVVGVAGFQELCCECYLVVRQHANLFINLFSLLLPAGLYQEQELSVVSAQHTQAYDTQHAHRPAESDPSANACVCVCALCLYASARIYVQMRQRFNLEEEDEVAATIFRALIVDSLGSLSTKFNWAIHTAKHVGL